MSDEQLVCAHCERALELDPTLDYESLDEPRLCVDCASPSGTTPQGPDLRSWLLFGLVAGASDGGGGEAGDGGAGGD